MLKKKKKILKDKLGSLNKLSQKMTLEKLFKHLQYSINEDELKAWEARNTSAHGKKMKIIQLKRLLKM